MGMRFQNVVSWAEALSVGVLQVGTRSQVKLQVKLSLGLIN
jgi:hypothetical protein